MLLPVLGNRPGKNRVRGPSVQVKGVVKRKEGEPSADGSPSCLPFPRR